MNTQKKFFILTLAVMLATTAAHAQSNRHALLHGSHVPANASQLQSLALPATNQVLDLNIGLPLRNQEALDQLLQDIYDPASPNYRHFLTPAEFTEKFGPTKEDYEAVTAYARNNGFTVTSTDPGRILLGVRAPAATVEKAFHLSIRHYQHPTEARTFFAPDAEPTLDLSVAVQDISGLDDYIVPHPANLLVKPQAQSNDATPQSGSGSGGTYAGRDFRAAYAPGVTLTGAGQSVGLIEFGGYYSNDIVYYENTYESGNLVPIVNVLLNGVTDITANPASEEALDIEMAISMAPGMNSLYYYRGTSIDTMLSRIASDNVAKQISASWEYGTSGNTQSLWQQLAAEGITFFNSAGDSDAYAVGASMDTCVSSPYITSVGGTTLSTSGPGGTWTSEKVWNWGGGTGTGGGINFSISIPSWQTGISMTANLGSTTKRNIPDVALTADNVYVRYNNGNTAVGGTSCAAPLWAGFMALVNQQAIYYGQPPIGTFNPTVYAIGKGSSYSSAFHDITSGNNFKTASPTNFPAVAGYDLCTGWGTPKGQATIDAISPPNSMQITPATGFAAYGPPGGPFSINSETFTLTNISSQLTVPWSLINTSSWLSFSTTNGTLAANGTGTLTVSLNPSVANSLATGVYSATILFTNQNFYQTRMFSLQIGTFDVWTGSNSPNGNWSMAANWFPTTPNATGDNLLFAGSRQPVNTNNSSVTSVGWVQLSPSVPFTIYGSALGITNGLQNTTSTNTWNAPLILGASQIFDVAPNTALTIGGAISGAFGFTKNDGGTLTLSGANSYTGQTVVTNGTVNVTGNESAATGGWAMPVNFGNATINFQTNSVVVAGSNSTIQVGSSPANGTPNLQTLNAAGTVTNYGSLLVARGGVVNLNGGTWTQDGNFTVSPPATSGYGAAMTINSGATLVYGGTNGIVVSPSSGNGGTGILTISGGTLTTSQGFTNPVTSSTGTATVILTGGGTLALTANIPALTGTAGSTNSFQLGTGGGVITTASGITAIMNKPITNVVGQAGSLTVQGSGTLVLSAANSYSGGTTVSSGNLQINIASALGSGTVSLPKGSTASGTLLLNLSGVNIINNTFSGFNSTTFSGNATVPDIENMAGTNTITSALTVTGTGGNGVAVSSDAGLLTLSGAISTTLTSRGVEFNGTGNGVAAGIISDGTSAPFFVNKDGTGTWTLSGANTYSSSTTISAGKLVLNTAQTGTGTITVKDNAALGVIVSGSGQLAPSTLSLGTSGPTTNEFSGISSTATAPVNTGTLSLHGTTVVNVLSGAFTAGQIYPLISFSSITGSGGFALGTLPPGVTATLTTNGNAIALNVSQTLFTVWKGTINTNWDITTTNWTINGTPVAYADGSIVQFDDTTSVTNVVITTPVSPGAVVFNDNLNNYALSGNSLSGPASIMKLGAGTLTLSNANTYLGGTTINGGAVQLNALNGAGSGTIANNSLLTLGGNGTLANVVSGGGTVSQTASGTVTLTANNTFTGNTVINSGTLTIGGSGQLGNGSYAGNVTNNATFTYNSSSAQVLAGTISGSGALNQNGPGELTLAGTNVYTGKTTINAGALQITGGGLPTNTIVAFANTTNTVVLDLTGQTQTIGGITFGTQTTNANTVNIIGDLSTSLTLSPATLLFAPASTAGILNVNMSPLGNFTYSNVTGSVTINNGASASAAGTATVTLPAASELIQAASLNIGNSGGGSSYIQTSTLNLGTNATLFVGNLGVGNSGSRASGNLIAGNGTLMIRGATGDTNTSANLTIGKSDSFELSDTTTSVLDATPGTLDAIIGTAILGQDGSGSTSARGVTINATFKMGAGNMNVGTMTLGNLSGAYSAGTYSITSLLSLNNSGVANITNLVLASNTSSGAPTLTLNSQVTINGSATLNAASITQGTTNGVGTLTAKINWTNGIISNITGMNLNVSGVSLVLDGTSIFDIDSTGTGAVSSVMSGPGSLALQGVGTLTVSSTNTYTGTTTVSGGTLLVNGALGTNTVTVASTAALGGTGVVNGAATVQPGGTLAPGTAAIGTLTVSNTLALNGNLFFKLNKSLSRSNDLVSVSGTLSGSGSGTLTLTNLGPALALGDTFKLFNKPVPGAGALNVQPMPGNGLGWTNNLAVDGTISIVPGVYTNATNITYSINGNSLLLSWPADHLGWRLLLQTNNLATGVSLDPNDWDTVPGSTNLTSINLTIDPTLPAEFFQLVYP